MKIKLPFPLFLGIVSIIGFLVIVFDSFSNFNLVPWANGLLFIIIGSGLALIGGIFSIKQMLSGGLTDTEIAHILTIVVGVMSVFVGLVTLPIKFLSNVNIPAFEGVKGIIAIFAIVFISIETYKLTR